MVVAVPSKKERITLYFEGQLKEDIEKLAEAESRSVNNLIEVMCKEAVRQARAEGRIK
jgi:hypothetical protein